MSFQAYLDNVELKTGKTPRALIEEASARGLTEPGTKTGAVIAWLKEDYDLQRGHAMAIVRIIVDRQRR